MFEVGSKVKVNNPKTQSRMWKNCAGTVSQILNAHNSVTDKDTKVYIITQDSGISAPIEVEYLS